MPGLKPRPTYSDFWFPALRFAQDGKPAPSPNFQDGVLVAAVWDVQVAPASRRVSARVEDAQQVEWLARVLRRVSAQLLLSAGLQGAQQVGEVTLALQPASAQLQGGQPVERV
jgi:hypothetical protein